MQGFPHIVKSSRFVMNEKELFTTVLENIQTKVSPQTFNAYFADLQVLSIEDTILTIACKNAFTKQTIEGKFFNTLINTAKNVFNDPNIEVQIIIKSVNSNEPSKINFANLFPQTKSQPSLSSTQTSIFVTPQVSISQHNLNPKYTFETFVVGSHNQLPHAAAIAIANNPGNAYNPFFIYGNVGLGKTHLMQAIGHEVLKANPQAKILYCSTEYFLNEMVSSIRTQKAKEFREKYRALDVLILDDIQFLSNKEATQEEFFNTFNALYQAGKQVILASDRPPTEIANLEDRIRSRFEGGLVTDIKSPNIETRIAILQKKLIERNEYLPESILASIAEAIDTNIRELEGALLKVSLYYKTSGNLTINDVRTILGTKILAKRKKINPLEIMNLVCDNLQIDIKDVKSAKRNYEIAYARQICMYLLKDVLNLQLVKIAKHVGRRDHTTIIHGISKIEKMIEKDEDTSRLITELKLKLQS